MALVLVTDVVSVASTDNRDQCTERDQSLRQIAPGFIGTDDAEGLVEVIREKIGSSRLSE